jgi:hypothetical protein
METGQLPREVSSQIQVQDHSFGTLDYSPFGSDLLALPI